MDGDRCRLGAPSDELTAVNARWGLYLETGALLALVLLAQFQALATAWRWIAGLF